MQPSDLLKPALSAFTWIWLPDAVEPVVCGRIDLVDGINRFTYGKSYLARPNAIPVWLPELQLVESVIVPEAPHVIAGALRDAAPDPWGRRGGWSWWRGGDPRVPGGPRGAPPPRKGGGGGSC